MDWLVFYKEFYFHEIERKYSLMKSMSLPVGVATIIASALLVVAARLNTISSFFDLGLLVLLICTALLLFLSVYYMTRAYFNHAYQYLPTTLQIASHRRELENFFRQTQEVRKAVQLADEETMRFLADVLASTAHHNSLVNDKRSRFLFWANASLSGALLLLILGGIATVAHSMSFDF